MKATPTSWELPEPVECTFEATAGARQGITSSAALEQRLQETQQRLAAYQAALEVLALCLELAARLPEADAHSATRALIEGGRAALQRKGVCLEAPPSLTLEAQRAASPVA